MEKEEIRYSEEDIWQLDPIQHIRLRPHMYIGKLGDGTCFDDGNGVCFKEIMDNAVDEFSMGYGNKISVEVDEKNCVTIRDYGRGIPLNKIEECVGQVNTSGKYGSGSYKKTVGLNGVGSTCVNALSSKFVATSYRDGKFKSVVFSEGKKVNEETGNTKELNGTEISYVLDDSIFGRYIYNFDFLKTRIHNYVCLNPGLEIVFNGESFISKNGLLDLINDRDDKSEFLYSPIRITADDFECVIVHNSGDSEEYSSFVNGQFTSQGGTHQMAFREAVAKTLKDFFKKDYEMSDMRGGLVASVKVYIEEPEFESQTKIRLSSKYMSGVTKDATVRQYVLDTVGKELNDYLTKNPDVAKTIEEKVKMNLRERKAIAGIKSKTKDQIKKASLNNKKLRDCKVHYTDTKSPAKNDTMIFITEGNSASGSITASRDVKTQAVFSLRGKPLNTFNMKKVEIYKNEEFSLLSAALDIEAGIENLRYNKVIIATDADPDGYHIRMLLLTYFVQFFPELIRDGHLFFLITPLFRVRNKKETIYCYNEVERDRAIKKIGKDAEVTRAKGLGEFNADEFKNFITPGKMELEQINFAENDRIKDTLKFFMGNNTPERFKYVCENLENEID